MILREYYKMFPKVINVAKSGRDRMIEDGFDPEKCDYCYNIIDETPILELAKEKCPIIFGGACTCRKYFAPAALGSVHQSEDWWWGGSEGSPLPS